jgi:hypothetical protein
MTGPALFKLKAPQFKITTCVDILKRVFYISNITNCSL